VIPRVYEGAMLAHFRNERQMLFLSGPRQVGKTTSAHRVGERWGEYHYLTWDAPGHRETILGGPASIADAIALERLRDAVPLLVLDEIHKHRGWKDLLKGLFDVWGSKVKILVTGSGHLDAFRQGGDSLSGRYFSYRMHPFSLAELNRPDVPDAPLWRGQLSRAGELADHLQSLVARGGYPEPLVKDDDRFSRRWRNLRNGQLLKEDLRDLTRIQDLGQVEVMAQILRREAGQLLNLASLARQIRVSRDTAGRWLETLESLYYVFTVRPWHRNVRRALRKEPKAYLWDWSQAAEAGPRAENLVACALLKACHFWTDHGWGEFGLHFLRDKDRREVDFLVSRDGEPWILAEVKLSGGRRASESLRHFQEQVRAPHAFQVAMDLPPVAADPFGIDGIGVIPATSLLARLV
jgi:predicted AAA+ superfamily ATPase